MSEGSPETEGTSDEPPVLGPGQQWERYERYPYLLAKVVFFAILIAAVGWVLVELSTIVFPIFMSLLLAYLLNPAVGTLQRKGVPRSGAVALVLTGLLAFLVLFAWVLYPTMAEQVRRIGERAPQAWAFLEREFFPWLAATFGIELPATLEEALEQYSEEIRDALPVVAERIGEWVGEIVTHTQVVLVSLFNLVMIPIFTVYFLRDFESGKQRLKGLVPEWRRTLILDRLKKMDRAVGQWFRGQLQVSMILAVLYGIGLGLVYGLTGHSAQSGVVIGLLTGFLNIVPYLGFAVGSLLAYLVILIEWTTWWALLGVTLAFTGIQLAESYYITPRVMGHKVGMSPVAVIIVLLIGGSVAGIMGVLLAIPVAGAIKVLLPDMIRWYYDSSLYTGVPEVPAQRNHREPMAQQSKKEGSERYPEARIYRRPPASAHDGQGSDQTDDEHSDESTT